MANSFKPSQIKLGEYFRMEGAVAGSKATGKLSKIRMEISSQGLINKKKITLEWRHFRERLQRPRFLVKRN